MRILSLLSDAVFHPGRVLRWRLVDVMPTEHETAKLDEADATTSEVVRVFMVWRRSVLITAIPSLVFSAVLGLVSISRISSDGIYYEGRNAFGRFAAALPELTSTILLISAVLSLYWWRNTQRSIRLVGWAWVLALIIPLLPGFIPTDNFYEKESGTEDDVLGLLRQFGGAVMFAVQLLPLIISIPQGVIQGSLRVRGLLPSLSLAGWLIVFTAPFLSMLMFAGLLQLIQLAGDGLLVTGAVLLSGSPTLYVVHRKLYTHATTKEENIKLDRAQLAIGLSRLLGLLLVLSWAFTYEKYGIRIIGDQSDNGDFIVVPDVAPPAPGLDGGINVEVEGVSAQGTFVLLPWTTGIRLFFESFGRTFLTILVVADAVLNMTLVDWKSSLERHTENNDTQKKELYKLMVVSADKKDKEEDEEEEGTVEGNDEEHGVSKRAAADGAGGDEESDE